MFGHMFSIKNGEMTVRLDEPMRTLLHRVGEELREVLLVNEPELTRRLYPTAYPDDEKLNDEYEEMVHDQLLMQRLDGIDELQATVNDDVITLEAADAWMSTINQVRLVLGTRLDVGENDDTEVDESDPDVQGRVVYQVLSHILEELTRARVSSL